MSVINSLNELVLVAGIVLYRKRSIPLLEHWADVLTTETLWDQDVLDKVSHMFCCSVFNTHTVCTAKQCICLCLCAAHWYMFLCVCTAQIPNILTLNFNPQTLAACACAILLLGSVLLLRCSILIPGSVAT